MSEDGNLRTRGQECREDLAEVEWGEDTPVTEGADGFPVVFVDRKPLTVTRANVNVDRAEVVVLLVACREQQRM